MTLEPHSGEEAMTTHESSHDTFADFKNWLHNNAGVGVYAHGRVHQLVDNFIHVSDLLHKRGYLKTDDILLMEEQDLADPFSAPSRLGRLMAMAMLPTMNTANGEGSLIAYFERGVVAFSTGDAPRETRHDGDGVVIQQGWDSKRLINHLLNTVGAVGRYAVVVLPRDHLFRSEYGLHFLTIIVGTESFNSENTNIISQDVSPLLEKDKELSGAAVGFWVKGHRLFASTGLVKDEYLSSSSYGRGFVSWNQASSYTRDRSPIPAWEGLWILNHKIHAFLNDRILVSKDGNLFLAQIDKDLEEKDLPWMIQTGQFASYGLDRRGSITDGTLECVVSEASNIIQVYIRTDQDTNWKLWTAPIRCNKIGKRLRTLYELGKPPLSHRECTWFQVKIEGVGFISEVDLSADFSETVSKSGRKSCAIVDDLQDDFFDISDL
jgi:hypothetical protein